MRVLIRAAALALLLPLSTAFAGPSLLQPTFTKVFTPQVIGVGALSTLTFTLSNPNVGGSLTNVGFTDNFPVGLEVSMFPNAINTCDGTFTAAPNTSSVTLTGGLIGPQSSCSISLSVTPFVGGLLTNTTGAVSSSAGGTGPTASATLFLGSPPSCGSGFGAIILPLNGTTTLLISVTNPNSGGALTGVHFTDTLPSGIVLATDGADAGCGGGTITAVAGTSTVSLADATLAPSDNCQFHVNVIATTAGDKTNHFNASADGVGDGGDSASPTMVVIAPPVLTKQFGASTLPLGSTTSLTFNLSNPNPSASLGHVGFTDNLPPGLLLATPSGLSPAMCGGFTITANDGASSVTLAPGAIIPVGGGCNFSVNVVGTAAGMQNNITSAVNSDVGGAGPAASASIDVVAPPSIAKQFGAASIPVNSSTSLTFTITNPAGNDVALTGVSVTDPLPSGLVVSNPNGLTGSCGGGTITANAGANSISVTGAAIPANSQCTFAVNVTGIGAGNQVNTTSAVTSTNGGTGNSAVASLNVLDVDLTIAKSHTGNFTQGQTGKTYTITVTNNGTTPSSGTVSVTDTLPAGLNATSIAGTGWSCATLICTRSDALGPGASYPDITVTVNVASNAAALITNTATVSGGGETNTANDSASDPTTVLASGLIAPTNLVATATSTNSITVTWNAVSTAVSYQVYRTDNNKPPTGPLTMSTVLVDTLVSPNTTYVYFVEANGPMGAISPPSNNDIATTVVFPQDPLVAGVTTIDAARVNLVRTAIDYVRATMGQGAATYTNPVVAGATVQASDVLEMRSTLDAIRSALNLPAIPYSNSGLAIGSTIRAADVQELTDGVK